MMSEITASTRVLALIGDPVSHSSSPTIQNAALRDLGLDGVYVALQAGWEEMVGFVRGLAMSGGGGNITLPHKEKAATVVDVRSPAVKRTGACNTFWLEDGKIHGDNSDVEGFSGALEVFLGGPPEGKRVLVLGAGGAARACLVSLMDGGVDEVQILNRTRDRARVVARRIGGARVRVLDGPKEADGQSYDLVVNTTRLGLSPDDPLPLDLQRLKRVGAVMDMVYLPRPTPFVEAARELGIRAADGMEMLVQQGAVSFERWWGQKPSLEVMRASLRPNMGP
ncbi:MAG: shikimate dehydrogenase [Longimicrobiales bacterium]|nr:shikimate dehydrogenase [Longimicrobiales bacterium]